MKKLMIMTVAAMALGLSAVAETSFAYQGVLRDELGKPLSADQASITFRLYNVASGGTKLWEQSLNLAIDTNGLFNAELSGSGLAEAIADAEEKGQTLYVGLTVKNSAGEITPRQKMIATPLAAYAQNVAKADKDFTVTGTTYFMGEVSMQKSNSVFNAQNVSASKSLDVAGATTLRGKTEIQGEVNVANALTVNGAQVSMPIGSIIMWSGSADKLPKDGCWALCDGKTEYYLDGNVNDKRKVPDLSGRFIVGAGTSEGVTYTVGETGGTNSVVLAANQIPDHDHGGDYLQVSVHPDVNQQSWAIAAEVEPARSEQRTSSWKVANQAGGNQAHENRPPYYALCYIIKIK